MAAPDVIVSALGIVGIYRGVPLLESMVPLLKAITGWFTAIAKLQPNVLDALQFPRAFFDVRYRREKLENLWGSNVEDSYLDAGFLTLAFGLQIFSVVLITAPILCHGFWLMIPYAAGGFSTPHLRQIADVIWHSWVRVVGEYASLLQCVARFDCEFDWPPMFDLAKMLQILQDFAENPSRYFGDMIRESVKLVAMLTEDWEELEVAYFLQQSATLLALNSVVAVLKAAAMSCFRAYIALTSLVEEVLQCLREWQEGQGHSRVETPANHPLVQVRSCFVANLRPRPFPSLAVLGPWKNQPLPSEPGSHNTSLRSYRCNNGCVQFGDCVPGEAAVREIRKKQEKQKHYTPKIEGIIKTEKEERDLSRTAWLKLKQWLDDPLIGGTLPYEVAAEAEELVAEYNTIYELSYGQQNALKLAKRYLEHAFKGTGENLRPCLAEVASGRHWEPQGTVSLLPASTLSILN